MYAVPIKTALLVFPIIAFFFTLPYVISQYRKYGSINFFRSVIVYSFILYMICIYFLVILPLPKFSEVEYKPGMMRIVPFQFVLDFIMETSFRIDEPLSIFKAISEPCFYTVFYNLIMTIPFGMYLRYYFKTSLFKTLKYSFLLSLFFELTQLSGLYFIYPYPYRIFDIDDLLLNTFGGVIGFALMGLFLEILPSRDQIDEESYENGKVVSGFRRMTMFIIDVVLYFIIAFSASIVFRGVEHIYVAVYIIYFMILPYYSGSTLGGSILKVELVFENFRVLRNACRSILIVCYYLLVPHLIALICLFIVRTLNLTSIYSVYLYLAGLCVIILFYMINIACILLKKTMPYDRLCRTVYRSTIFRTT